MAKKPVTAITAIPFRGGAITHGEIAQVPLGGYSMIQNMRQGHPGFFQRKGMATKHGTADGTNKGISLYQFSKGQRTERHFFSQFSDGGVLEATDAPPTVTAGVFGSEVHGGTATDMIPASWSNIKDLMIYSNGSDQHQIYAGTANYVTKFIKYDSADTAPPDIPDEDYKDYSKEVTDGITSTHAVLDDLDTYANYECIFICTPIPANRLTWTMGKPNGTAAVGTLSYRKSDNTWEPTTENDGTELLTLDVAPSTDWAAGDTITGNSSHETCIIVAKTTSLTYQISTRTGAFTLNEILTNGTYTADQGAAHPQVATLGYTGSMTWTHPSYEIPFYMFGVSGFWYRWETATKLDGEVEVSNLTYGSAFQDIVNLWDGIPAYAIEARFYDKSGGAYKETPQRALSGRRSVGLGSGGGGMSGGLGYMPYYTPGKARVTPEEAKYNIFSGESVEIDAMVHSADDSQDRIYFNSVDPITAVYVDVGDTPNTNNTAVMAGIKTWTGIEWTSVGTIVDGTNGFTNSGWITFGRPTTAAEPVQFQKSRYLAYWYYIYISTATLSDDVQISIETMPFFDVKEAGEIGKVSCAWKGRGVYTFNRYPWYLYVSAAYNPLMINGNDYAIFESGDGRTNPVVCELPFYNELLVFQEERGVEGGCITLFEGNSVANFGKVVISSKVGTYSAKSAVVVDGVLTSTATEEKLKSLAFFLSRYGVCVTDGMTVSVINDDIQNYFDTKKSECIRRGYEKENFIFHDTCDNVLRLGLVSGISVLTSTATSTTGNKLNDTAGAFTTLKEVSGYPITHKIAVGDTVHNTTDNTDALITAVNSATQLTLDTDIMVSEDGYEIYSAVPNLFPVFDLIDKTWSFDSLGQNLSCMCEVEAASGNLTILQYGGGTDDGAVYRLNTGTNDVDIATVTNPIDAYATMELDYGGNFLALRRMLLRVKSQAAGDVTITPYRNTRTGTAIDLSMIAETTGDAFRRHRFGIDVQDPHISMKFRNATASQELYLLDVGHELYEKPSH